MSNLGKAYVQIIPKAEGITDKIKTVISPGSKKAGAVAGNEILGGIKKALTVAAIGAPIVAGIKAALDEGGKLQQSYGGLETLYGDAADAAKEYAAEAAKAGISANEYAEQAVSFGASLKQAFGGDAQAAVEAANMAIMDMADNAAKMGTPIESIQNAYQGFAKQNYTMLDNLKLGYGGTKTEMERLLADATKLTGVEYDISNLGDVYEAIHAIQVDLGLTGVAASEAENTFTGSMAAMKAAAQNVLANLALGEDVAPYMEQLAGNAGAFFSNNLLPMVGNIIRGIPSAAKAFIDAAAPQFVETGKGLINNIISGAQAQAPVLAETVPAMMNEYAKKIKDNLPTVMEKGGEILSSIIDGIMQAIPGISESVGEAVTWIAQFISDNIPTIGEKGGEIMASLAETIIKNLPTVAVAIQRLTFTILQALLKAIPSIGRAGNNFVIALAKSLGGSVLDLIHSAMDTIKSALEEPIQSAKDTIGGIIDRIRDFFPISVGNIFSNLKLPHFSLSGTFSLVPPSVPHVNVDWYAKAMEQPYVFNRASLIGVGEAGDEMVYGRSALLRDIREATGGQTVNVSVTVNGAENPEEWANRFAKEFVLKARTA